MAETQVLPGHPGLVNALVRFCAEVIDPTVYRCQFFGYSPEGSLLVFITTKGIPDLQGLIFELAPDNEFRCWPPNPWDSVPQWVVERISNRFQIECTSGSPLDDRVVYSWPSVTEGTLALAWQR